MVEPATTIMGGMIGAVIALLWNDPYRNNMGQYTSRQNGFASWLSQAAVGALLGAALTSVVIAFVLTNPALGILLLIGGMYFVYTTKVDPR
ncbi:hypothetical protein [Haloarcula amylovorans]|uniref:hypothetical protein n=1 Tax=Haloarcula amylovorans TaxID=2562280 RepID=UPI00107696E5|nr:hypothetical protein [Halomicroarcula amylolytica]